MKIHGLWKITLVGNVLVRTTAGRFNDQGTLACFQDTQLKAPIGTQWAILGDATHWELSNASSLQSFPQMREWVFAHGCQCIAMVVPNQVCQMIHQRQTGHFPEDSVRYFSSMQDACEWLEQKGFPFDLNTYPHHAFLEKYLKSG